MSNPYPPPPKKLMRRPANKMIGGVCSGVADYLNMDVTLVRILTVVISLFTGVPIILYVVALFVVPEEGAAPPPQVYPPASRPYGYAPTYAPAPSPGPAPPQPQQPPQPPADPVWGSTGAPWEQPPATAEGTDPVDPFDPVDPVDPVDPIDPVDPVDPGQPTGPERRPEA